MNLFPSSAPVYFILSASLNKFISSQPFQLKDVAHISFLSDRRSIMHSALKAAIAYISESRQGGASDDVLTTIKQNQICNLKSMISRMTFELPEVTQAMALLREESPFTQEQNGELLQVMHCLLYTSPSPRDYA